MANKVVCTLLELFRKTSIAFPNGKLQVFHIKDLYFNFPSIKFQSSLHTDFYYAQKQC